MPAPFATWLSTTMQSRGLSQAQIARAVGVADAQVSRWRRGQVVPTVRYLQRLAETLDVPRAELDRLAGYPVDSAGAAEGQGDDPERQAELRAYQARYAEVLRQQVPPALWRAYAEACEALARSLSASYAGALAAVGVTEPGAPTSPGAPGQNQAPADSPEGSAPRPEQRAPGRKGPIGFRP